MSDVKILYICDREACKYCHDSCEYTTDINHAVNRDSLDGRKFEYVSEYNSSVVAFIELEEEVKDE